MKKPNDKDSDRRRPKLNLMRKDLVQLSKRDLQSVTGGDVPDKIHPHPDPK